MEILAAVAALSPILAPFVYIMISLLRDRSEL